MCVFVSLPHCHNQLSVLSVQSPPTVHQTMLKLESGHLSHCHTTCVTESSILTQCNKESKFSKNPLKCRSELTFTHTHSCTVLHSVQCTQSISMVEPLYTHCTHLTCAQCARVDFEAVKHTHTYVCTHVHSITHYSQLSMNVGNILTAACGL